jgi:hypothetical protein
LDPENLAAVEILQILKLVLAITQQSSRTAA